MACGRGPRSSTPDPKARSSSSQVLAAMFHPKASWRIVLPATCRLGLVVVAAALAMASSPVATAQEGEDEDYEQLTPEEKLPASKEINLETSDGVRIVATYYPGDGVRERDTVPVIMIHGEKENRQDFHGLAIFLQQRHHAIVALDLRGHGDSTRRVNSTVKIDPEKMKPEEYMLMSAVSINHEGVIGDVEKVRNFLLKEHAAKKLNIDKLCLIGSSELGCLVAMNWAMFDWALPDFANVKQGREVKAIVLLSPKERFKSLKIAEPFGSDAIRKYISFYIAVGTGQPERLKEAEKISKALARERPKPNPDVPENTTLYFNDTLDTKLQGTKLLGQNLDVEKNIAEFINKRIERQHIAWKERKKAS
jgi:pimeloyl-ACP methyl ester carboxylesterase